MLVACSHLVIATDDVPKMLLFFKSFFGASAHFENEMFGEFVLPSGFRIAFFKPVGAAAKYFHSDQERRGISLGVTTREIDALYARAVSPEFVSQGVKTSGPPKEHPWGEKSFLLIDPDGNRWEIAQSPSDSGMLVNLDRPAETGKKSQA